MAQEIKTPAGANRTGAKADSLCGNDTDFEAALRKSELRLSPVGQRIVFFVGQISSDDKIAILSGYVSYFWAAQKRLKSLRTANPRAQIFREARYFSAVSDCAGGRAGVDEKTLRADRLREQSGGTFIATKWNLCREFTDKAGAEEFVALVEGSRI